MVLRFYFVVIVIAVDPVVVGKHVKIYCFIRQNMI